MKRKLARALIEIASILFLFYANLLMGEYTYSGPGHTQGLAWALTNIFTIANLAIGLLAAILGYFVFEFLRKKL